MGSKTMTWLIGAKIACCGALLLALSGALSLGAISTFLSGNALPLAGISIPVLMLALRWLHSRAPIPPRRKLNDDRQPKRNSKVMSDA